MLATFFYLLFYLHKIYFLSIYFLGNRRSKKNEEEKKKISESVLRYHDQIAGQTIAISKIKEDLVKEQKAKCALEERLAKAGNQTTRLDEEIVQLKAMSNVNWCLSILSGCNVLNSNLLSRIFRNMFFCKWNTTG